MPIPTFNDLKEYINCGGEAEVFHTGGHFSVECKSCGNYVGSLSNIDKACDRWNQINAEN